MLDCAASRRNEEKKRKQERVQELAILSRGRRVARAQEEDRRARLAMMDYQHQVFWLGSVTAATSNMYAAELVPVQNGMNNIMAGQARSEIVQNFRDRGNMFGWSKKGSSNIDVSVEDPIEDEIGPPAFARHAAAGKKKNTAKGAFVQIDDED